MVKNKLRTILTGVTVAFSILLFTLLFGIVNGLKNSFSNNFKDDAETSVFIYPNTTSKPYKGYKSGRKIIFKNNDLEFIKREFPDEIDKISSRIYRRENVSYKSKRGSYLIRAVNPDHQFIERTIIVNGRFLSKSDLKNRTKNIVVGQKIVEEIFSNVNPVNKLLKVGNINYRVIGHFKDDGNENEESILYTPVTTAQFIYGKKDEVDQINLMHNQEMNEQEVAKFIESLTKILREKHNIDPDDQGAIFINSMSQRRGNVNNMLFVLSIIVFVIAFGTLVAGIVGVSNILVFVVRERTKELGIRKALGAKPSSIIGMIIQESILITAISGYFGMFLGYFILSRIKTGLESYNITNPTVELNMVIGATIVLILSGILAGYLPAKRASKIKPIVALSAK